MATNLSVCKKMIRIQGRWQLVQVKDVFTHPGLNDVFLGSHDLDFYFKVCLLAKPFCLTHGLFVFRIALALTFS